MAVSKTAVAACYLRHGQARPSHPRLHRPENKDVDHRDKPGDDGVSLKQSWIASRSLSSCAHSRDPLARNDQFVQSAGLFRRRCVGSIPHSRMRCFQPRAPRTEQFFAQCSGPVGGLVASAPRQFRHQHIGNVLEIAGRYRKRDIQPVDIGLLEPGFDCVGDLFRRTHNHRSDAADADMLRHLAHGPYPVRIGAGDVVHRRAAGVVLDMANLLVEVVGRKVDPRPAGHQR